MANKKVKYKKGYKYQLYETYIHSLRFTLPENKGNNYVQVGPRNTLIINKGYAWDGPSGPAIDTKDFMKGSLVHDALYGLISHGLIDNSYRKKADKELYMTCRDDGMSWIRAKWVFTAVKIFGGIVMKKKKIIEAP